ncbi:MAG: hypothetical protein IRY99_03995 [Isosphaeraceae bacterium]|nr:hypothetical protein [Isosphaeraceae bacterium]
MPAIDPRDWARFPLFDPAEGTIIRHPPGEGPGYWIGAPGAAYDAERGDFYLVYRLRRPRGIEPDRGAEVWIARSRDGFTFEDIWTGTKDQLQSPSIERCALVREPSGRWALYISYVDPADGRWRIDRAEADRPDGFNLAATRPVLTADAIGAEGVKDPIVFRLAGLYHMLVSFAAADRPASTEELHGTADAYNTGLIRSATGLATSDDGLSWRWEGEVLGPSRDGWDRYCARIGTLWYEPPVWLALYDGSASVAENYEERCGLAYSHDLRHFHRVSRRGPLLVPPHGTGALRYFDVLSLPEARYFYYEMARLDGGHDLRVLRI